MNKEEILKAIMDTEEFQGLVPESAFDEDNKEIPIDDEYKREMPILVEYMRDILVEMNLKSDNKGTGLYLYAGLTEIDNCDPWSELRDTNDKILDHDVSSENTTEEWAEYFASILVKEKITKCLLCDSEVEYKELTRADGKPTHIWVCEQCPFVGFEYIDDKDTEALSKYLSR